MQLTIATIMITRHVRHRRDGPRGQFHCNAASPPAARRRAAAANPRPGRNDTFFSKFFCPVAGGRSGRLPAADSAEKATRTGPALHDRTRTVL